MSRRFGRISTASVPSTVQRSRRSRTACSSPFPCTSRTTTRRFAMRTRRRSIASPRSRRSTILARSSR